MIRSLVVLILVTFAVFSKQSYAWGLKELGDEAASPVTTDAKYVLYAGTLLTLTFIIFEDQVSDPFQEKQVRNKTLGGASIWGDRFGQLVPNILYVAGMGIAGQYGDTKAAERAIGMFKATAYAISATTILKYTVREPRPNAIHEKNSFPSGHTTSAFSFSGYVAAEHGWGWGSAALLSSTFVAYSRINDNRHFLHDITAGATIGWVYGWGIAKLEKKNKDKEKDSAHIVPIIDTKTAGLSLYKEF